MAGSRDALTQRVTFSRGNLAAGHGGLPSRCPFEPCLQTRLISAAALFGCVAACKNQLAPPALGTQGNRVLLAAAGEWGKWSWKCDKDV